MKMIKNKPQTLEELIVRFLLFTDGVISSIKAGVTGETEVRLIPRKLTFKERRLAKITQLLMNHNLKAQESKAKEWLGEGGKR